MAEEVFSNAAQTVVSVLSQLRDRADWRDLRGFGVS